METSIGVERDKIWAQESAHMVRRRRVACPAGTPRNFLYLENKKPSIRLNYAVYGMMHLMSFIIIDPHCNYKHSFFF